MRYGRPQEDGGSDSTERRHSEGLRTLVTFMSSLTQMREWLESLGIIHLQWSAAERFKACTGFNREARNA